MIINTVVLTLSETQFTSFHIQQEQMEKIIVFYIKECQSLHILNCIVLSEGHHD